MKFSIIAGIFAFFFIGYMAGLVLADDPTIFDLARPLYKKAQGLQNEFPELTTSNRCEEYKRFEEQGKPVHPFGVSNPAADIAWENKRQWLKLLCNFETMLVKINSVAKSPDLATYEYIATLTSTLDTWEFAWRAFNATLRT